MIGESSLINDLRARGFRVTPQRAMIFEVMEGLSGHVTAEEIYAQVHQTNPYISLTTVYRTLELLKEIGLVTESNMGTATMRYALSTHGPHHHAVCRKCKTSIEMAHSLFEPAVEKLRSDYGFKADANHIIIYGLCEKCQAKG